MAPVYSPEPDPRSKAGTRNQAVMCCHETLQWARRKAKPRGRKIYSQGFYKVGNEYIPLCEEASMRSPAPWNHASNGEEAAVGAL